MVKYFRFCLIIAYVVQIDLMLSMTSQSVANNALVLSKNNLPGRMQFPNTVNDVISSNIDEILRMNNLSYNLANAGYNVAKYVPYGPVKSVLPYLFRRAQENTAIAGQMGRELSLILKEKKRRGNA